MKTVVYSAHKFEQEYLFRANQQRHELVMLEVALSEDSAHLAIGCTAASIFVSDQASAKVIGKLHELGIRYLALRSAGYNHVDLKEAKAQGIVVARVPDYSPYAIAEHTVALMLALNRQLVHAHNRIHELNFSLDGLTGFDMHGKTIGIAGTGKIGSQVARLFFEDHSQDILQDDIIARLMTLRNVLITSHQAFLTDMALENISTTTIHNLDCFEKRNMSGNELT